MDPRGGYYNTDFISGTSSIIGSLAIDLLARPAMDYAEKTDKARVRAEKVQKLQQGRDLIRRRSRRVRMTSEFAEIDSSEYEKRKRQKIGKKFTTASKQIKPKNFGGAKNLLRGLSWTLFATFIADTAESVFLPGVTGAARKSDQMAMGMGGPLDSEGAYTQRQRALMAIHDSQLGIRSVIGNEAGHFHR